MKPKWRVINHGWVIQIQVKLRFFPWWQNWGHYPMFYKLKPSEIVEFDTLEEAHA